MSNVFQQMAEEEHKKGNIFQKMTEKEPANIFQKMALTEEEERRPGYFQKAIQPLKRIPEIQKEQARSGLELMKGVKKPTPKTLGLGALGALQYGFSPITATMQGLVGEPVEEAAKGLGVPPKAARFIGQTAETAAYFATPGGLIKGAIAKGAGPGFKATQKMAKPAAEKAAVISKPKLPPAATGEIKTLPEQPLPKYAGSINLERQAISEEAKRLELETFERFGKKRTVSHKKLVEDAQATIAKWENDPIFYEKRLKAIEAGKTPTIQEELAHRLINTGNQNTFIKMAKEVEAGVLPKEALNIMQNEMRNVQLKAVDPLASAAGRRLGMYNIVVGRARALTAVSRLAKPLNKRQLKELNEVIWDDAGSVNEFIKRLPDPKLRDYAYEIWYNAILSGIPTHLVNVCSNTLWASFQMPHRGLVGSIDLLVSKLTGRPREVFVNEVIPMWAGYKTGYKKGAPKLVQQMRSAKIQDAETKWGQDISVGIMSAFERSPYKALNEMAPYVSFPSRSLIGMDILAKAGATDAQMGALALRIAQQRGLTGLAAKQTAKELLGKPTKEMRVLAEKFARYNTFTDDPGKFSDWIIKGRNTIPLARVVVPFVRTVGNLTRRGVEMTPGLGLAIAKGQIPAEVIAKQIEGSVLGLYILHKCQIGDITGEAPQDPAKRERFYAEGKLPWAIRQGDTWYSFRRLEPFNTIMASVAVGYDALMNAEDEASGVEIFGNIADGLVKNLVDGSYMQGITRLLDRYGGRKGMIQRQLASFVPYSSFWRSINRSYEVMTKGKTTVKETRDLLGAFGQVIPTLSDDTPERLNVWGETIPLPGGVFRQWLPYKWSQETGDPLELELAKLEIYPGLPSQVATVRGEKVKFPDDFYRDYCIFFGKRAKQRIEKIISTDAYKRMPPEGQKRSLDKSLTKIRLDALGRAKYQYYKKYKP